MHHDLGRLFAESSNELLDRLAVERNLRRVRRVLSTKAPSRVVVMVKQRRKRRLGRIIARRELDALEVGPKVAVSIGAPRRLAVGHWESWFSVEGIGKTQVMKIGGADALQALLLAIEGARVALDKTGGIFFWLDSSSEGAGSGIPRFVPTNTGRLAEARINIAIERESKRFFQRTLNRRKVDIAACEAEVKKRREVLEILEDALKTRKARAAQWQADLKKWNPAKTRRIPR